MSFWQDSGKALSFYTSNQDVRLSPSSQASVDVNSNSVELGLERTLFRYNEHLKNMFQFGGKRSQIFFLPFKFLFLYSFSLP